MTDVCQRAGRGGRDGAIAVVELLGRFVFTPKIAEIALLVQRFQQCDMFNLLWLVELQNCVSTVETVIFGRHWQAMPGAEVLNLDPALPAARVATLHARCFQLRGVVRQVLPGFRRLIRV
ncbi:hypothetical protein D3C78_856930 [compost metagenome]